MEAIKDLFSQVVSLLTKSLQIIKGVNNWVILGMQGDQTTICLYDLKQYLCGTWVQNYIAMLLSHTCSCIVHLQCLFASFSTSLLTYVSVHCAPSVIAA